MRATTKAMQYIELQANHFDLDTKKLLAQTKAIEVFADHHITIVYTHNEEKQKLIAYLDEWEQLQREDTTYGK